MHQLTEVSIKELIHNLDYLPEDRNLLLFGDHGIGKSQIVTQYYEKKGFAVVPLFLGQMSDAGDLTGLPYKKKVILADGTETERTDFLPPAWWDDTRPFCLFLDEINRARPEILNVIMDLVLNKKLGGRALPKGSVIVAAANIGERYAINDLDAALFDRFVPFVFRPTVDEWLGWADENDLDYRVRSFIANNPDYLDGRMDEKDLENLDPLSVTPSRRSWVGVAAALTKIGHSIGPMDWKFISGFIGAAAVSEFATFITTRQVLTPEDVLLGDFNEDVKRRIEGMETVELVRLNDQLKAWLEKNHGEADRSAAAENLEKYLDFLQENKRSEAVGHLMAFFQHTTSYIMGSRNILRWIDRHLKDYAASLK